jgi:hypothetical protein
MKKKNKMTNAQCPICGTFMDKVVAYVCKCKECRCVESNLELSEEK